MEEILSGERHSKFRDAVNVLLVSLRVSLAALYITISCVFVSSSVRSVAARSLTVKSSTGNSSADFLIEL